jgi:hypothetical protein
MMATTIAYTGRADIRVLNAEDLKRLGVEGFRKTEFKRNQEVEVDAEVAKALTEHEVLGKQFTMTRGAQQYSLLDEPELATEETVEPPAHEGNTEGGTVKRSSAPSTRRTR